MKTALKLCAFLPVLAVGCAGPLAPLAIIVLTNTWQEEGVPSHTIFFQDDTDGENSQSSGTFTGTETLNGIEYAVSGSWGNSRVTMTMARTAGVTWRAPITEDDTDRLSFSSTAGTLVLVRNVN